MWQLFHIHANIQEREEVVAGLQESLDEHQAVVTEKENLLKDAKKAASTARGESTKKDRERMKLEAEVGKLEPSVIESSEAIQALKKRLAADEKQIAKIERENLNHAEKLAQLQEQIDEHEQKENQLQKEYDELKQSESEVGTMTEEQEVKYERIRDAAAVASAKPRQLLQTAVRALESARAKAAKVEDEKNELNGRKNDAERAMQELSTRKESLERVSTIPSCQFKYFHRKS